MDAITLRSGHRRLCVGGGDAAVAAEGLWVGVHVLRACRDTPRDHRHGQPGADRHRRHPLAGAHDGLLPIYGARRMPGVLLWPGRRPVRVDPHRAGLGRRALGAVPDAAPRRRLGDQRAGAPGLSPSRGRGGVAARRRSAHRSAAASLRRRALARPADRVPLRRRRDPDLQQRLARPAGLAGDAQPAVSVGGRSGAGLRRRRAAGGVRLG